MVNMPRGRGRGGNNPARGGARQGTRDRRYNVCTVGGISVVPVENPEPSQPSVARKPSASTTATSHSVERTRRPNSIIPTDKIKVELETKEPTLINDDPDHLYRSKIPPKDPKIGYGLRYNPKDPNAKIPVTKIYVTKIRHANKEKLTKEFSRFGPVKEVKVTLGELHSMAFVTFEHHKDALKVLSSPTIAMDGYTATVKEATQKHQPKPTHIDPLAAVTAPDKCYIEALNDDCMRHIFSYLNLVARTKVEVVCKCWHRLSRNMWLVVRSLDFCAPPLSTSLSEASALYDFTAKQLTSYTGHNLAALRIRKFASPNTLRVVRENCTALEELTLVHFQLFDAKQIVIPSIKTIKHIGLAGCAICDKLLVKLFSIAKCLESISISRHTSEIDFIQYLNHIKSFTVYQCDMTVSNFTKFLTRNSKTLTSLSLTKPELDEELYNELVDLIVTHAPTLEILALNRFTRPTQVLRLAPLFKLKHLTSLSLSWNVHLTGDILTRVTRNCLALQNVVLDLCTGLTAEAVASLGKLPQLKSLSLAYTTTQENGLSNEAIIGLVNNLVNPAAFQHLVLSHTSISDEALYAVLTLCPGLEFLNVASCPSITEASLMTAEEAVAARTQAPLSLVFRIENTQLKTALDEAQAVGKQFNPRLIFTGGPSSRLPAAVLSWYDRRMVDEYDMSDEDDDDDDDDDDDEHYDDAILDALDFDSDDEYMFLMGMGVEDVAFEHGMLDIDYLGDRLANAGIYLSDTEEDDDINYAAF